MRYFLIWGILAILVSGCGMQSGNIGQMQTFSSPILEADWVREGEPIEFEGEKWFPQDGTESFVDAEMLLVGETRGVQFFIYKEDVKPYDRLYTKFARNKFRYFKKEQPKP
jgi:hypothetical protein